MGNIAYIFPGQGAQYYGMGRDFYDSFEECRSLFDRASGLLEIDMVKLCFTENEDLNKTEYTQAAILLVCAAILTQVNLEPKVLAGLSLGEYTALLACKSITFDDAIKLVRQRGILMQDTVPEGVGGMAAILGLDFEIINEICEGTKGIVSVANYNCPGQIVITGEIGALEEAGKSCLNAGAGRVLPLKVSGPFHSMLLKPAAGTLEGILKGIEVKSPEIPYVTNVTAEYIKTGAMVKELLTRQIYSPVKWIQSIETMIAEGVESFVEIGPGRTLSGFVKKINKGVRVISIEKVDDLRKLSEVR